MKWDKPQITPIKGTDDTKAGYPGAVFYAPGDPGSERSVRCIDEFGVWIVALSRQRYRTWPAPFTLVGLPV